MSSLIIKLFSLTPLMIIYFSINSFKKEIPPSNILSWLTIMLTLFLDILSFKSLSSWVLVRKEKVLILNSINSSKTKNSNLERSQSKLSPLQAILLNHHVISLAMRRENNSVFLLEILFSLTKLVVQIWLSKEQWLLKTLLVNFTNQFKN